MLPRPLTALAAKDMATTAEGNSRGRANETRKMHLDPAWAYWMHSMALLLGVCVSHEPYIRIRGPSHMIWTA